MSEDAPQFDETQRVQDPEKARVMAEAEDQFQESAIRKTETAAAWEQGLEELDSEQQEHHREMAESSRNTAAYFRDVAANHAATMAGEKYDAEEKGLVTDTEKAHVMALAHDEALGDMAEMRERGGDVGRTLSDKYANRVAEWAGVLHEHPVSREYAEAHPEVSFTPEGLYSFEKSITGDENDIEDAKEMYADFEEWVVTQLAEVIQKGLADVPPIPLDTLDESNSANIDKEFVTLLINPHTTLADIQNYDKKKYIGEFQKIIDRKRQILEDIRSGRAAEKPKSPEADS
jgi:hypothetical protein